VKAVVIDVSRSPFKRVSPLPMDRVSVSDCFWRPRLEALVRDTLPSQHKLLEATGRIDNFRRAAGKLKEPFKGLFFNDSDVYKWIEAASYALVLEGGSALRSLVERTVEEVVAAQDEDGYLNTYFTFERRGDRWGNLRDMHELYCAGHLMQAAVAHHRVTGERTLLDAATRFADHIASVFGPGRREGVPGHPEVEMALVELYRETGDGRYLALASYFIDARGRGLIGGSQYHIDHRPFRELEEVTGHAVRMLYLCCGATDVYIEKGDRGILEALERLWRNFALRKMYVTGGAGSRHEGEAFGKDYELPNERAYAETCAAVANVMWNWRLLVALAEPRFADLVELALYNAALAGISLDGTKYFYVNPLASDGSHRRQDWFECACCPPNIARLLSYLPNMIYSVGGDGIWVNLYVQSSAEAEWRGGVARVEQRTRYPWEGNVEITVKPTGGDDYFALHLRIPAWSRNASVRLDGELVFKGPGGSFLRIERRWEGGRSITLGLEMKPELVVAHPLVSNNACRAAIRAGPLVYCLEQADNPGFDVRDAAVIADEPMSMEWRGDLLRGVNVIKGKALIYDHDLWGDRLYTRLEEAPAATREAEFTAIPYYAWANREPGPMTVWPRVVFRASKAKSTPSPASPGSP